MVLAGVNRKYQIIILGIMLFFLQFCMACAKGPYSKVKEPYWNFKLDYAKHEIVLKIGSDEGLYDGETFKTCAPLLKNDKVYFPVRFFEDAHLAKVHRYGQIVDIDVPDNRWGFHRVRYKLNEPSMCYVVNGNEVGQNSIAQPFEYKREIYIPVDPLISIDKKISFNDPELKITWKEVVTKSNDVPVRTKAATVKVTIMYNQYMPQPNIVEAKSFGRDVPIKGKSQIGQFVSGGTKYKFLAQILNLKINKCMEI